MVAPVFVAVGVLEDQLKQSGAAVAREVVQLEGPGRETLRAHLGAVEVDIHIGGGRNNPLVRRRRVFEKVRVDRVALCVTEAAEVDAAAEVAGSGEKIARRPAGQPVSALDDEARLQADEARIGHGAAIDGIREEQPPAASSAELVGEVDALLVGTEIDVVEGVVEKKARLARTQNFALALHSKVDCAAGQKLRVDVDQKLQGLRVEFEAQVVHRPQGAVRDLVDHFNLAGRKRHVETAQVSRGHQDVAVIGEIDEKIASRLAVEYDLDNDRLRCGGRNAQQGAKKRLAEQECRQSEKARLRRHIASRDQGWHRSGSTARLCVGSILSVSTSRRSVAAWRHLFAGSSMA